MVSKEEKKRDKKLLYPIFHEASEFTFDPYWKQVFDECSKGKFPKGSSIDNTGKIVYFKSKQNNVSKTYKLNDDPKKVFQELKQLFYEQINLKSNRDRQVIKDELNDICENLKETFAGTWQKIKRKKIKDPIIRSFILDLKSKYELNDEETKQLIQLIKLGFIFNWIDNNSVIYKDQRILDIESLHFNPDERKFILDKPSGPCRREYKSKSKLLSTMWDKYLDNKSRIKIYD